MNAIETLCPSPVPVTIETHKLPLQLAQRYRYTIFDSLIIATALDSSCTILYSEDLHHGQNVEGLKIQNPYRSASPI